jgi:hypothetical protein
MRAANTLYEFGRTVLIHTEEGTTIKNLDADESISDVLGRPFQSSIIIDIGQILKAVDDAIISTKKDNK